MQAVILAGGIGKRLKPVTDYIPKPMIPINNTAIIEWQLRHLKKHRIDEVIICTGYKADQIEHFLKTKEFDVRVRLSKESSPLGTAGAIKKTGPMIHGESFVVMNGDVITDINIDELYKKKNSVAAIELKTKFGIMDISDDIVTGFSEKKSISGLWMNAGIYHLGVDVLEDLPKKGNIEKTLFPRYAKDSALNGVKFYDVMWYSIDSFKDIKECEAELKRRGC